MLHFIYLIIIIVCVHVCAHSRGSQKLTLGVLLCCFPCHHLLKGFVTELELHWLAGDIPGPPVPEP